jgi:two-component system nitrogen regulation response regulator NtrX
MKKFNVLVVDDEADIRNLIKGILEDEGYAVAQAGNSKDAYSSLKQSLPDLLILDIWLQGSEHDGMQILETVRTDYPSLPVIMISGHGTIETAVNAIKLGAYDFIEKPFKTDRLILMIARALETARLRLENAALRRRVIPKAESILGNSSIIQNLRQILVRVAETNSRVLLSGEPGSGKDLSARFIHLNSSRRDHPFIAVNCAILHPERLESELFGHVKLGEEPTIGILEQVNGGTLLLDEVADMPMETQAKILRVLQEQKFQKLGTDKMIEVDVRVIASSNRDLKKLTETGQFRQDLFYRLNVVPIRLSPLREHAQDIPVLVTHFMSEISAQTGLPVRELSEPALLALQAYAWPGNIRQLRNTLEWLMIMSAAQPSDTALEIADLPAEISGIGASNSSESSTNPLWR